MGSRRYNGKPLKKLLNIPLIGHCYKRCKLALGTENVYVATCDQEIEKYINNIGGKVILTSKNHKRASTRTSEALLNLEKKLKRKIDIVIMYQGDEPLVNPLYLKKMINLF